MPTLSERILKYANTHAVNVLLDEVMVSWSREVSALEANQVPEGLKVKECSFCDGRGSYECVLPNCEETVHRCSECKGTGKFLVKRDA